MSSKMGRPPEAREATFEAVQKLADAGETDKAQGGVPTNKISEEVGRGRKSVSKHCNDLLEEGKLRRVIGVGPHGPRPSWLPADGGDK